MSVSISQWLSHLGRRLRALRHPEVLDRELNEEMRFHVESEAAELARTHGLAPDEARRRAHVAFGGAAQYTEEHRDARGFRWLADFSRDVRYAVRGLRRSPGFSVSAVLVLALGIGASTAVFSAVTAVLLDPDYDGLVAIFQQNSPTNRWTLSTVDVRAIEAQQRSFSTVGAIRSRQVTVSAGAEPQRAETGSVTSGFFRALRIRPAQGRSIEPSDEPPGSPPVAVIGNGFAIRTFGNESSALGRTLTIDGIPHTVVGVLPVGLTEMAGYRNEIWSALQLAQPDRRGPFGLRVLGRLSNGVTLDAARRDLAGISERLFPLWASSFQDREARLTPHAMRDVVLGSSQQMLSIFSAAVLLVLLIGIANIASLMLVRVTGRGHEIALRTVLGSTSGRIVRLVVTESMVLAGVGAVAGIALGAFALRILPSVVPRMPGLNEAHLDARAVAFAIGLALLAGLIVGSSPVALLLRRTPVLGLQGGGRTIGGGERSRTMRGVFVVAEFALSLPLLAGAALLLNSFLRLQQVDPGFDPRRILSVRVSLPSARFRADSSISGYWALALPLVRQVPGVLSAGLGSMLPPDETGNVNNFDLMDKPVPPGGAQPTAPWPTVTDDYFTALGVPLLDGRLFTSGDTAGAPPVVVVSRTWARHYFPDGPVLGRQLISGGCVACPRTTVVGVVGDVKYEGLGGGGGAVYDPLTAGWFRDVNLFVRTAESPGTIVDRVRAALRSVDPSVPLEDAAPMEDRLTSSMASNRHWTGLLGSFAIIAVGLAAVGIFGMISFTASARRREIGVRMALGARRSTVVSMIVRRGMGHAALGAGIGLMAAVLGTRWLEGFLYAVSASDPVTLLSVTLLLLAVAFVACWLPAWRAAGFDPVEAIRLE